MDRVSSLPHVSVPSAAAPVKSTSLTERAEDPAVVFFPTNQDSECMDGDTGHK